MLNILDDTMDEFVELLSNKYSNDTDSYIALSSPQNHSPKTNRTTSTNSFFRESNNDKKENEGQQATPLTPAHTTTTLNEYSRDDTSQLLPTEISNDSESI